MVKYLGALFVLTAAVVGVHMILEPLFWESSADAPGSFLWAFIDPWMAVAVVIGAIIACKNKRDHAGTGGDAVTHDSLRNDIHFYGFLFIGMLLLRNWFIFLNPLFTSVGADTSSLVWFVVDAGVVLLCLSLGTQMWNGETDD